VEKEELKHVHESAPKKALIFFGGRKTYVLEKIMTLGRARKLRLQKRELKNVLESFAP
jgi:hypothetical protein